jgi:hypothetical protein
MFGDFMMFSVHIIAATVAFWMVRGAPDWIQKIIISLIGVGMTTAAFAFGAAMFESHEYQEELFKLASQLEHLVMLLFIFRLYFERHIKWKSLPQYRG